MYRIFLFTLMSLLIAAGAFGQSFEVKETSEVYKRVDGNDLKMTVYTPSVKGTAKLPVIVFFFGGGWVGGNPDHFRMQAEYFASRGVVVACPEYRTKKSHNVTPFECVKDARSAMRYIKLNSGKLGIDPDRVVAAGGSAGGHLASCTAIIDHINEQSDNLHISPSPFALVLFNPVVDTSKRGYGSEKVKGREFEASPVHHIRKGLPPTLIMHGDEDTTVPFENVVRFTQTMKQAGNECTLVRYKGQKHGFFNFNKEPKYFKKTVQRTERFLEKLE